MGYNNDMPWQIILCVVLIFVSHLEARDLVSEKKQTLSEIQSEIKENKEQLKPKKERKKNVEKKLFALRKDLKYTTLTLQKTQKRLHTAQTEKKKKQKEIQVLSQKFKETQTEFSNRIVKIYKDNQLGMLSLVLLPNTMMEVTEVAFYFDKILQSDIQLINKMNLTFKSLENQKQALNEQVYQIATLKTSVVKRKKALKNKKIQQQKYIRMLAAQISEIERRNHALERSSQKLEQLIKTLGKANTTYFGTGKMIRPTTGWISSRFGVRKHPIIKKWIRHNGIDLAARKGTRIYAADSGKVLFSGQKSLYRGYGKIIVIDHGKRQRDGRNISTFYAHTSRILVKKGQMVKKGDEVGWVGATGYATGPHLHFEVRENGRPVNPLKYIRL